MLHNILHCCLWQQDYIRCEGLYLPIAFSYGHLDTSYSHLDTRYSRLDTRYSHLQLPVVVLKHLYNLSNHLATGYYSPMPGGFFDVGDTIFKPYSVLDGYI